MLVLWSLGYFEFGIATDLSFLFCSKREVNKKVLKVPGIEQKVMIVLFLFS